MDEVARAPLTFGQLSVWRSIEDLPPERGNSANLAGAWPLPPGSTPDGVRAALDLIERRHESLRTGYQRSGTHGIEQVVWPARGVAIDTVEVGDGGDAGDVAMAAEEQASALAVEAFALEHERPWRLRLVTSVGRPTHLAECVHHMAADGAGIGLVHSELRELLAGGTFTEPAPTCRALAVAQREDGAWQRRTAAALAHWRGSLAAAGPAPSSVEARKARWGRLRSVPALAAAQAVAAATETSVHSVVFAAFCRTLSERLGETELLVALVAGNRTEPRFRSLVSSVNQLVPLVVRSEPGESFAELTRRLHWQTLLAYRRACFDVDAVAALAGEQGYDAVGTGFRHFFNFMPGTATGPPPHGPEWTVEVRDRGRDNGFPFYLKAGDGTLLDGFLLDQGDDPARTDDFLRALHELLVKAGGQGSG
jgi:hypothetical protein